MAAVTASNDRADLAMDVLILTEMVTFLMAKLYENSPPALEIKRLPERIMKKLDAETALLRQMAPAKADRELERLRSRLQKMLDSVNVYRGVSP